MLTFIILYILIAAYAVQLVGTIGVFIIDVITGMPSSFKSKQHFFEHLIPYIYVYYFFKNVKNFWNNL